MIFLNPAILFGLLAASIPVLIHLLNLRKLKKIEFSTLTFLKELQKTKVRKIKLKQWILLALRILIILLIVFAFARPAVESVTVGGAASAAKTSAVFVMDNTYSMSVVDENGSYLNHSKQIARSILNEFRDGDEIAFLTVTGHESNINPTGDFTNIANNIERASISEIHGNIYEAVETASEILNESQNFNKEFYIFSDLQKQQEETVKNILSQITFDRSVKIYVINVAEKEINNLAVTDVSIDNQIFEKGKPVGISATITNKGMSSAGGTVASLYLNGKRSAQQNVSLNPGESQVVTFATTLSETGLMEVLVELEDDEINYDNKRYAAALVPERYSVLLLYDNANDVKFIETVLNNFSNESINLVTNNLNRLNSENLQEYDVVFVIGSRNVSNVSRLTDYVSGGGGLVVFPGSQSTLSDFNSLCSNLTLPGIDRLIEIPEGSGSFASFDQVDFNHPVFTNLFEGNVKPQVSSPQIYKYFRVNNSGSSFRIISLVDNSVFMMETKQGNGKILTFTSAPILSWSDFPLKGLFAPLIVKSVFYLGTSNGKTESFVTGQEIVFNQKNIGSRSKIVKPDKSEVFVHPDSVNVSGKLRFADTDIPGVYQFISNDAVANIAVVNVDPAESNSEYIDIDEFKSELNESGITNEVIEIEPGDNYSEKISQARFGVELWRYFLIAALILALVEMFVARNTKKDLANVN